ncbi:MAG: tetratricopeptide repeat protein [Nitrospira sp. SB0678_bin_10]|nr:tetratricopeptide repeat protein [Nitrospira sp. SB0678_bin_10]
MDKPTDNDTFENDGNKQSGSEGRSATPVAADEENQRRGNVVPNQPWYKQKKSIKLWLAIIVAAAAVCGVLIDLAGNLGFFERFQDSGQISEEDVRNAERHVEGLKEKHDEAEKLVKSIREMYVEIGEDVSKKAKEIAREIENNSEAQPLEKAIARALSLQLDNEPARAIQEWEKIAKNAEGDDNAVAALAWFSVGYLLRQDSEASIRANDKAIHLEANFPEAYNNRGIAKTALGRLDDALADYDKAIRLKPKFAKAYNNRGMVKKKLRRLDDALADYDEAIRLKPKFAKAYNNRGMVKKKLRRLDDALADYDEAIRLKPKFAKAYYNRGLAMVDSELFDDALTDFDAAIQINPNYFEAYINRGSTNTVLGRYESAIADYDEAIRLKRDFVDVYLSRAGAKYRLGRKAEARKDLKTALKLARKANNTKLATTVEQALRDSASDEDL